MQIFSHLFEKMISSKHLFLCWDHFKRGKRKKKDILSFERRLEDYIFQLEEELKTLRYQHGPYHTFKVCDPKERNISKACVRDRLVHEMLQSVLTYVFDKKFIFHSFSSRMTKGTHKGVLQLKKMIKKVSLNGQGPCYALKMDIFRFFDTVNQSTLKKLIRKNIHDERALVIIDLVIDSFKIASGPLGNSGIPLGNVTSQLFSNLYLHELDMFIKHALKESYYLRYCDDFIILGNDEMALRKLVFPIQEFLINTLQIELHPKKISLKKLTQGIDFLGYVIFIDHSLLRIRTKKRMKRRLSSTYEKLLSSQISPESMDERLNSYLGLLSHANQYDLSQALKNGYWAREKE